MKKFNLIIEKKWITDFILPYELILKIEHLMKENNVPLKRRGINIYSFLVDLVKGKSIKKDFKVSPLLYIEDKLSITEYLDEAIIRSDFDKKIHSTIKEFIKEYNFDTTLTVYESNNYGEIYAYTNRRDNDPSNEAIERYMLNEITTGIILKTQKYDIGSIVPADGIFQDLEGQYYWYWEEDLQFGKYSLSKFNNENIKDYI